MKKVILLILVVCAVVLTSCNANIKTSRRPQLTDAEKALMTTNDSTTIYHAVVVDDKVIIFNKDKSDVYIVTNYDMALTIIATVLVFMIIIVLAIAIVEALDL